MKAEYEMKPMRFQLDRYSWGRTYVSSKAPILRAFVTGMVPLVPVSNRILFKGDKKLLKSRLDITWSEGSLCGFQMVDGARCKCNHLTQAFLSNQGLCKSAAPSTEPMMMTTTPLPIHHVKVRDLLFLINCTTDNKAFWRSLSDRAWSPTRRCRSSSYTVIIWFILNHLHFLPSASRSFPNDAI